MNWRGSTLSGSASNSSTVMDRSVVCIRGLHLVGEGYTKMPQGVTLAARRLALATAWQAGKLLRTRWKRQADRGRGGRSRQAGMRIKGGERSSAVPTRLLDC